MKKLYRGEKDSLVAGIISGIGEYFDVDPTILRLGFIVLVLVTGVFPGVIAYFIAYFIIPDRPREISILKNNSPAITPPPVSKPIPTPSPEPEDLEDVDNAKISKLKRPDWPVINVPPPKQNFDKKSEIENKKESPEIKSETPTIDSIFDRRGPDLDDLIDE